MALFKIYNNIDSKNPLPSTHTKGYMYFDAVNKLFYIDIADDADDVEVKRVALNSWGAQKAYADVNGDQIDTTYLKVADAGNIISSEAEKVKHKLTFGADQTYVFDGSADVTVPVYTGNYV